MKSRRHTAAFTMIELMVALVVAVIATTGIYALYSAYVRAFVAHDRVLETQQTARTAIDALTQDLLRAGYKIAETEPAVVSAAPNAVTLVLFNEQARDISTGVITPQAERVRYYIDATTNELRRDVFRRTGSPPTWSGSAVNNLSGVIAENARFADLDEDGVQDPGEAPALAFQYYTENAFLSSPSNPAELDVDPPVTDIGTLTQIRRVKVTVTIRSSQRDPVTNKFVYRTLQADVKPRNAGLMSSVKDDTSPAPPTGLLSVDRGDCGFLYLSWDENTEPDLAGYAIYYGTTAGSYTNRVAVGVGVPHSTSTPYRLGGLGRDIQYYIAIAAYDASGNEGSKSAQITGTSSPDTTPNIANPDAAPTGLTASGGLNRVNLSWTKVDEPDVIGYRVYRKESAFTTADLNAIASAGGDPAPAGAYLVADHNNTFTISGTTVSFADTTSTLKGCSDVYYAVTAVKGCGTAPSFSYVQSITTYNDGLFARTGPAQGSDSTGPDPADLRADSSYLRNYLNITNPTNSDFVYSLVAYKTGSGGSPSNWPTFTRDASGTITTNGTLVECRTDPNGAGAFTGPGGPQAFTHSGAPCDLSYHLLSTATYYYTAVAVDSCKNLSNYAQSRSQPSATQCGDETTGIGVGNPPKVTNVNGVTRRLAGGTKSDARLTWDATPDGPSQIRDHAGYYVYRTYSSTPGSATLPTTPGVTNRDPGKGLILNPNPSVFYSGVSDANFEENTVQKVRILSVDCDTVVNNRLDTRYTAANFNTYASDTLIFYPGTFVHNSAYDTRALGRTNNVLEFQTKTTIHSAATSQSTSEKIDLRSLTVDWTSVNASAPTTRRLKSVTLNSGSTSWTKTFSAPGLASPVSVADLLADGGARMGVRTGSNVATWRLEFYDSTTGTESRADMRRLGLRLTVGYQPVARRNTDTATLVAMDSAQTASVTLDVPATRGPDILGVAHRAYYAVVWCDPIKMICTTEPAEGPFTPATTTPVPGEGSVSFPFSDVEVTADVVDNSGKGLKLVKLYYAVTYKTATVAPPFGAGFPTTIDPVYWTGVTICQTGGVSCSGTGTYRATLPAQDDLRVWFFFHVEDNSGNYATSPVQETVDSNLAYVYDQEPSGGGPL